MCIYGRLTSKEERLSVVKDTLAVLDGVHVISEPPHHSSHPEVPDTQLKVGGGGGGGGGEGGRVERVCLTQEPNK